MPDPASVPPLHSGPPFADWREQLRERVKEIRARKMAADRRQQTSNSAADAASTATAEKLRVAREAARAAEASAAAALAGGQETTTSTSEAADATPVPAAAFLPNGPGRLRRREEISEVVDDLLHISAGDADGEQAVDEPTRGGGLAPSAGQQEGREPARTAEIPPAAQQPGHEPARTAELPSAAQQPGHEPARTAELPPEDEIPLFQEEPTFFDEEAQPATLFDSDDAPEEAAPEVRLPAWATATPAASEWADARTEPPAVTDSDAPASAAPPAPDPIAAAAPPPDLDAIPPDMKDVPIPAWALPRRARAPLSEEASGQRAGQLATDDGSGAAPASARHAAGARTGGSTPAPPTDAPVPPSPPADVYLVGEFASAPARGRIAALAAESTDPAAGAAAAPAAPAGKAPLQEAHVAGPARSSSAPEPGTEGSPNTRPDAGAAADQPASASPTHARVTPVPRGFFDAPATGVPAGTEPPAGDAPARDPGGRQRPHGDGRRFPGLFDAEQGVDPASRRARQDQILDQAVSPAQEDASRSSTEAELTDDATAAPAQEPRALEWDLDAPSDPDTILEAQRDPLDPSAPISDRVFSSLADALVLLAIGLILAAAAARAAGSDLLSVIAAAPGPFVGAWALFGFVYAVFFVGTCGQTLGKMAMRVRVIGTRRFRVGYTTAARRAFCYLLAILPAFLGLLPALRDPEHRALHDRWSGTRVVKA